MSYSGHASGTLSLLPGSSEADVGASTGVTSNPDPINSHWSPFWRFFSLPSTRTSCPASNSTALSAFAPNSLHGISFEDACPSRPCSCTSRMKDAHGTPLTSFVTSTPDGPMVPWRTTRLTSLRLSVSFALAGGCVSHFGSHFRNLPHFEQSALAGCGPVPGLRRGRATVPQFGQCSGGSGIDIVGLVNTIIDSAIIGSL
jgi:hypothetical protein